MARTSLEVRRRKSAFVALMQLRLRRAQREAYRTSTHVGTELLCLCAIRVNDVRKGPPLPLACIVQATGLPITNVRRYVKALIKSGRIMKRGGGYVGRDDHFKHRIGADYFKRMTRAIITCARMLEKLD